MKHTIHNPMAPPLVTVAEWEFSAHTHRLWVDTTETPKGQEDGVEFDVINLRVLRRL